MSKGTAQAAKTQNAPAPAAEATPADADFEPGSGQALVDAYSANNRAQQPGNDRSRDARGQFSRQATTPADADLDDDEGDDEDERPTAQAPEPAQAAEDSDAERFSLEEARKLRRENAKYRTTLKGLQAQLAELDGLRAKLTELEDAQVSEQERLHRKVERYEQRLAEEAARAKELETRARERALEAEVAKASRRLNIVDEDGAFRLMDRAELEFDEDGRPSNLDAVLKTLVRERPWLVARDEPDQPRPSAANPPRSQQADLEHEESIEERRTRLYGGGGAKLWSNARQSGGGVFFRE